MKLSGTADLRQGSAGPLTPAGATAAVLGAGRSGLAAASLLLRQGYRVNLTELNDNERIRAEVATLIARGAQVTLGGHDPKLLAGSDFIIISPGIDERMEVLQGRELKGIPLYSEVELAYWFCPLPLVAVSGTNGKTTTVSLIGAMLEAAGIKARVAGNIGLPLCRAVAELTDETLLVVEISSFQLHTIKSFRPRLGVLLNLSPDHLERYDSVDAYYAAKMRLFENMDERDLAILNAGDTKLAALAGPHVHCPVIWFGLEKRAETFAFVEDGEIRLRSSRAGGIERVIGLDKIRLRGSHNLENILAAGTAAAACGAPAEALARAVRSFEGLPNRLEPVGHVDGVLYVNDSKATTVESVLRALESFSEPLVLIMGGRHKGSSYAPLEGEIRRIVRLIIALGEAAGIIAADLGPFCRVEKVSSLEEAVGLARETARPGETVLLSPGCSSFDMFRDYEQRGETFREIVRRLK